MSLCVAVGCINCLFLSFITCFLVVGRCFGERTGGSFKQQPDNRGDPGLLMLASKLLWGK